MQQSIKQNQEQSKLRAVAAEVSMAAMMRKRMTRRKGKIAWFEKESDRLESDIITIRISAFLQDLQQEQEERKHQPIDYCQTDRSHRGSTINRARESGVSGTLEQVPSAGKTCRYTLQRREPTVNRTIETRRRWPFGLI